MQDKSYVCIVVASKPLFLGSTTVAARVFIVVVVVFMNTTMFFNNEFNKQQKIMF